MTRPAHTPAMGDELKPCPFCGADDAHTVEHEQLNSPWFVFASHDEKCPLVALRHDSVTEAEAIAAWNTRPETQSQATIDELVMLLGKLCDAYELVCADAGKNYHQSPSSVYAHCRHAILLARKEDGQ